MTYRHILLAVTGMTPQVITETVWALTQLEGIALSEVHIITTQIGERQILEKLLDPQTGAWSSFLRTYGLQGQIALDASHIEVIGQREGCPLSDIRTPQDSALAADTIVSAIRSWCEQPDVAVHVSIAGGRKTMGYLVGNALTIFARAQDTLSHVLVRSDVETNPSFYYPNVEQRQEGLVSLVKIPFIRLRQGIPDRLLNSNVRYSQVVEQAQLELFPQVSLRFNYRTQSIICSDISIRLTPKEWVFYYWLAQRAFEGLEPINPYQEGREEVIGLYERFFPYRKDCERIRQTMSDNVSFKATLQSARSLIHRKLSAYLPQALCDYYFIHSQVTKPHTRYHLTLMPDQLDLTLPCGV